MKIDRLHTLRMILFAGLATLLAVAVFYFLLTSYSLVIKFSADLSLTISNWQLLGVLIIFAFDLQILLFELKRGWKVPTRADRKLTV